MGGGGALRHATCDCDDLCRYLCSVAEFSVNYVSRETQWTENIAKTLLHNGLVGGCHLDHRSSALCRLAVV